MAESSRENERTSAFKVDKYLLSAGGIDQKEDRMSRDRMRKSDGVRRPVEMSSQAHGAL